MQVQARARPLALAAPQRDRFNKHRRPVFNPNESGIQCMQQFLNIFLVKMISTPICCWSILKLKNRLKRFYQEATRNTRCCKKVMTCNSQLYLGYNISLFVFLLSSIFFYYATSAHIVLLHVYFGKFVHDLLDKLKRVEDWYWPVNVVWSVLAVVFLTVIYTIHSV